jgi:hypothetical protein
MSGEVWRALARKYIVYDVPYEMAACFDCRAVRCSDGQYESCPNRLAEAAALRRAHATEDLATIRTTQAA